MKIIRNGLEIELTNEEMRNAYMVMKRKYFKEDVEAQAEEMEIDISKCVDNVVDYAAHALDNNDSYWDSYWMSIEYALDELKNMG